MFSGEDREYALLDDDGEIHLTHTKLAQINFVERGVSFQSKSPVADWKFKGFDIDKTNHYTILKHKLDLIKSIQSNDIGAWGIGFRNLKTLYYKLIDDLSDEKIGWYFAPCLPRKYIDNDGLCGRVQFKEFDIHYPCENTYKLASEYLMHDLKVEENWGKAMIHFEVRNPKAIDFWDNYKSSRNKQKIAEKNRKREHLIKSVQQKKKEREILLQWNHTNYNKLCIGACGGCVGCGR
jgi:hypothetical protein